MSNPIWCVHRFSDKSMPCSKYLLQQAHPITDEICVTYQRYTWCTWHHPLHSCHRPVSRVLWTGDTPRPRSCLTEVSEMNCSLEWAWRFGQCAYDGFGLWRGKKEKREGKGERKRGRGGWRERGKNTQCFHEPLHRSGLAVLLCSNGQESWPQKIYILWRQSNYILQSWDNHWMLLYSFQNISLIL